MGWGGQVGVTSQRMASEAKRGGSQCRCPPEGTKVQLTPHSLIEGREGMWVWVSLRGAPVAR